MIAIDRKDSVVTVTVLGDFSVGDFKEFERVVVEEVPADEPVNLLIDLREMQRFTVDMVLEEIKFSREHQGKFVRIALLSDSPWVAFSAWLEQSFVAADLRVFKDVDDAEAWLAGVAA